MNVKYGRFLLRRETSVAIPDVSRPEREREKIGER